MDRNFRGKKSNKKQRQFVRKTEKERPPAKCIKMEGCATIERKVGGGFLNHLPNRPQSDLINANDGPMCRMRRHKALMEFLARIFYPRHPTVQPSNHPSHHLAMFGLFCRALVCK